MELKGKPKPGPYSVDVLFQDGVKMTVLKNVDDASAIDMFNQYIRGIGAIVGTTRQVRIVVDDGQVGMVWIFGGSNAHH
jgi:hypothetical protein